MRLRKFGGKFGVSLHFLCKLWVNGFKIHYLLHLKHFVTINPTFILMTKSNEVGCVHFLIHVDDSYIKFKLNLLAL